MQLVDGFKSHLRTLSFYGIVGNFDGIYKYYSVVVLTMFFWPNLIFEVLILIGNIDDLDRVGNSYLVLSHLSTAIKLSNFIINNKNVAAILYQINSDGFNPHADGHKKILGIQIKHVQNVFNYFFGVANVTVFFMVLLPIIPIGTSYDGNQKLNQSSFEDPTDRRQLPFDWSNEQFDVTKSPVYEIAYFSQIQMGFCACHICVAIDCFVSGLLHMVATQFDILSLEIQRLGDNKKSCSMVQIEMEKCIQHHVKLLNICNEVADTFNGVYLAQCCVTSIIMCITAIKLSSATILIEIIALLSYILCVIFELYMFCHYGNKIFIKTGDILPAIYQSQWYLRQCKCGYKLQRKHLRTFRQGIHIMMERAKYATSLRAAKLFPLNYATFVKILKSGYSFYAVLNSTN